MLFFAKEHRTLHDRLAGTVVVIAAPARFAKRKQEWDNFKKRIFHWVPFILLFMYALSAPLLSLNGNYDKFDWPTFFVATVLFRFSSSCDPTYIQCFHSSWLNTIYHVYSY